MTAPSDVDALINECCRFLAQTFTAGKSGTLAGVNVDVFPFQNLYPLRVSIRTAPGGIPSSTVLGQTTLPSSGAPFSLLITFPSPITLTAGASYAIVVDYPTAPPAGAGQGKGVWLGVINNPYPAGAGQFTFDGSNWFEDAYQTDLHFRTFVSS